MLNRPFRWAFSLFLLVVLAYFCLQIIRSLSDPLITALTYWYQAEDTISVTGWVVRQEQLLPAQTGILELTLSEGERVGRGQTVARLYDSSQARSRTEELSRKQSALEQLRQAQEALLDADSVLRLDGTIRQQILALRQAINRRDFPDAESLSNSVRTLSVRRSYAYGDESALLAQVQSLSAEVSSLRQAAQAGVRAITAPLSGTYSAFTDGYESLLTPSALSTLSPEDLQGLTPSRQRSNLGRLILGDSWYFATVLDEAAAQALKQSGQAFLRFSKGPDRDFSMTVERVGRATEGNCVVVLKARSYLSEISLLRHQSADLVTAGYQGLRVPANAIQVQRNVVTDSQGVQLREERITGVYCVAGMSALFKPVQLLYLGEDYYLVQADSTVSGRILRAGDEIIVNARGLYDGKVVR